MIRVILTGTHLITNSSNVLNYLNLMNSCVCSYDNNTGRCKIYESYDFAEGRLIFGRKIRPRVRSGLKLRLAGKMSALFINFSLNRLK